MTGDLVKLAQQGQFDVIVQGCNCFCTMGSGIAAMIRSAFPEAFKADLRTKPGDKSKIGTYTKAIVGDLTIINAYTQYKFGLENGVKVDRFEYDGFEKILKSLSEEFPNARFGFPLIGCGLAGGDERRILGQINDVLGSRATIVRFGQ